MSNTPDDLVRRMSAVEPWATAVEAHLDAHPLPVDDAAVQAAAARVHARLSPHRRTRRRRPWPLALGAGLAVAATVALVVRPAIRSDGVSPAVEAPSAQVLELDHGAPTRVELHEPERTLTAAPGSVLWTRELDHSAIVLLLQGSATVDGADYAAGTWILLGQTADGGDVTVTFRDGDAPPALNPEVWPQPSIDAALREVRWHSLPDRTTDTLDQLLEDP